MSKTRTFPAVLLGSLLGLHDESERIDLYRDGILIFTGTKEDLKESFSEEQYESLLRTYVDYIINDEYVALVHLE